MFNIITLISALVFSGLCGWRVAIVPPMRASSVITATGVYALSFTSSSPRPQTHKQLSGSETWMPYSCMLLNGHQRAGGCKKTSWLVDWKTSLGSEICKHFPDKFMSSVTYFWSYGIKHKVSFGNCAHSKSQKDWLSLACLLALDSQVLSQWTCSFTVKAVGEVMAASSICNPAANTRVTPQQPQLGTKITFKKKQ